MKSALILLFCYLCASAAGVEDSTVTCEGITYSNCMNCSSCSDHYYGGDCFICQSGYYLVNGYCVATCPAGFVGNSTSQSCGCPEGKELCQTNPLGTDSATTSVCYDPTTEVCCGTTTFLAGDESPKLGVVCPGTDYTCCVGTLRMTCVAPGEYCCHTNYSNNGVSAGTPCKIGTEQCCGYEYPVCYNTATSQCCPRVSAFGVQCPTGQYCVDSDVDCSYNPCYPEPCCPSHGTYVNITSGGCTSDCSGDYYLNSGGACFPCYDGFGPNCTACSNVTCTACPPGCTSATNPNYCSCPTSTPAPTPTPTIAPTPSPSPAPTTCTKEQVNRCVSDSSVTPGEYQSCTNAGTWGPTQFCQPTLRCCQSTVDEAFCTRPTDSQLTCHN